MEVDNIFKDVKLIGDESMETNDNKYKDLRMCVEEYSCDHFEHNFIKKRLALLNDLIDTKEKLDNNPGEVSDGYHTFNELYHHRAILFAVLCNTYPTLSWKSKQHHDPDQAMYDGMFIVGINTPEGQATYHYNIDPYWDMFNVIELERAPEWDGHTPDDAIKRIGLFAGLDLFK